MSLVSRALEAAGVATTSISAARDITAAARPSRAVFVDFPHGHTTGRVGDPAMGAHIVRAALELLSIDVPDTLVDLDVAWDESDDWKDEVFRPVSSGADDGSEPAMVDDRTERIDAPQYQLSGDQAAANDQHRDRDCLVCVGIDI